MSDPTEAAPDQDAAGSAHSESTAAFTGDFAKLYEAHSASIYYLTLRLLGGLSTAEIAAQSGMSRFMRRAR